MLKCTKVTKYSIHIIYSFSAVHFSKNAVKDKTCKRTVFDILVSQALRLRTWVSLTLCAQVTKKFSCGFSLTGRKLLVNGIKYMVAIQHYLCHAGKQGVVSFLYGIICVPFQSFSSVSVIYEHLM